MSTVYNFADGYNASGKSTYDIWKDAGNTGEVSDFLEFIKQGNKGEQGLQGLQGPDGQSEYELWLEKEGKSKEEFPNREFETLYMRDAVSGYIYIGKMINGELVFELPYIGIRIDNLPDKTIYVEGEAFDSTGMVIVGISANGIEKPITHYNIYPEVMNIETTEVIVSYKSEGISYTVNVPVHVISTEDALMLVDFTYTINSNGTYTLETWKGTLNGVPSTEIFVPDNPKIVI